MDNIKIGGNFVTAKVSNSFETLGFNETNTVRIYSMVNGSPKSWQPGREVNSLNSIDANQGYYIVSKTAYENLFFTPPLLRFPSDVVWTKTSTTIIATFTNVLGAASYQLNYQSSNGSGTANVFDIVSPVVGTITGLTPNTTYDVWISVFTDTNFKLEQAVGDRVQVTTDAS